MIILCPSCRIQATAMNLTLCVASAFFLLLNVQLVLGNGDTMIAEENLNTGSDCWHEVESILLNSSHHYTACMYFSRQLIHLCFLPQC